MDSLRPPLPDTPIYIALNFGGMGDDIARLPALKYMLKENKHARVTLACGDFLVPIIEHFFKGQLEAIVPFSQMTPELMAKKWIQTQTEYFTPQKTHLVKHAFSYICDTIDVPIEEMNYLQFDLGRLPDVTRFSLPTRYVVITTGYTAEVRRLPSTTVNEISSYLSSKNITPVYLGSKSTFRGGISESIEASFDDGIDYSNGIDLRDQTSILEAAKVMSNSCAVVGLDNGLLHVAGCTSAPIIGAYTNALPIHRLPIRNNTLGFNCRVVTPPGCFSCQSTIGFLPDQDYRNCVFPQLKCNDKLTANLFIQHLEELL